MTSPVHDAELVGEATDRLLAAAAQLDSAALKTPSRLPGWTRGHVLAHLARNADALLRVLADRPAYESAEARAADIDRDAARPPEVILDDLRHASARLDGGFAVQGGADDERWSRTVHLRDDISDEAACLPFHRWTEIELHHVDLGIGYGMDDLPGMFIDRQLTAVAERFAGHPGLPRAVELRAEDGTSVRTGAAGGEPAVVAGGPTALVGWLTGRTTGSGLSSSAPLPELPQL